MIDPLGGINTLWPLFGIANQMLAGIALILCTVVLFKMKRERYAWVTLVPTAWLLICTLTAGWQKLFHADPRDRLPRPRPQVQRRGRARARCWPRPRPWSRCSAIIFNDYVDAALAALFIAVVVAMLVFGSSTIRRALGTIERDRGRGRRGALWREQAVPDIRAHEGWTVRAARLMVGIPDYDTYVRHARSVHPDKPVMTYEEFFIERQNARYGVGKGRMFRCC